MSLSHEPAIDNLLSHLASEAAALGHPIVQMGINTQSLAGKKLRNYEKSILKSLKMYPAKDSSLQLAIGPFVAMAESCPVATLKRLFEFFPPFFGVESVNMSVSRNIYSGLPKFGQGDDGKIAYVIGALSDVMFSYLADLVVEKWEGSLEEGLVQMFLNRVFVKANKNLDPDSLQFRIVEVTVRKSANVVRFLNKMCPVEVATFVQNEVSKKRELPTQIAMVMKGLAFVDYSEALHAGSLFNKVFDVYSKSQEVISGALEALVVLLPQIESVDRELAKRIERKIDPFMGTPGLSKSVLQLSGVLHSSSLHTHKHDKFLEKDVFKRMQNPKKLKHALMYMNNIFRPTKDVFNRRPELAPFVKMFYQHLIDSCFESHMQLAAELLRNIAAYDFQRFVSEIVPGILHKEAKFRRLVLQTLEMIMNPMYGFVELVRQSPQFGRYESDSQLLSEKVIKAVQQWRLNPNEGSDVAFTYTPVENILKVLRVPTKYAQLNTTSIPSKVLYFMTNITDFLELIPYPIAIKEAIRESEDACKRSLDIWKEFFDIPHTTFGDVDENQHLNVKWQYKKKGSWEIDGLKLVHFIMARKQDFGEITSDILDIVVDADVEMSLAACMTYETFIAAFPKSASLFLNAIGLYCKNNFSLSQSCVHRIALLYSHCLDMCKDILRDRVRTFLDSSVFVAFCALCSPYPETRQLGVEIFDVTDSMSKATNQRCVSFNGFLKTRSASIEQRVAVKFLSQYSATTVTKSPLHRIPAIRVQNALLSPFSTIWRFFLVAIFEEIVQAPAATFIPAIRTNFLEQVTKKLAGEKSTFNELETNKLLLLMTTASGSPSHVEGDEKKVWLSQIAKINILIDNLIQTQYCSPAFSFVFASVHLGSLSRLIEIFVKLLTTESVVDEQALGVLASILRYVSMQVEFNDYVGQMMTSGQIKRIFDVYDRLLPQVPVGVDTPLTVAVANFLMFRAMYFRYLYRSRLDTTPSPIPRCSRCSHVDDDEISPVMDKKSLFELLFQLCQGKNVIANTSIIAINYLAALSTIFKNSRSFNTKFFEGCSVIAKQRPTFLKYLLCNHFHLLFHTFVDNALCLPLGEAEYYLDALSNQFLSHQNKDSLVYSHDTLVFNQEVEEQAIPVITEQDEKFFALLYLETGPMILLDLIFLMHDDIRVRQSAMRMLAQLLPVLCLIKNEGDILEAKELMKVIRKVVLSLSTQNSDLLLANGIELSTICSKIFIRATEAVFKKAFTTLPKIWQTRKCCTRDQMIRLLTPWTRNMKFDLQNRIIMEHSELFSCYSFMVDLCVCMNQVEWTDGFSEFWQRLAEDSGISFLVLAVIDIAISNKQIQDFAIRLLTYLYRLETSTINFLIPLINYSNWYFYYVQLGKFEEIKDMNEFLDCQNTDNEKERNTYSYHESTEFALKTLTALVKEDIVPLSTEGYFAIIVSFCLTHMNRKSAFILLREYAEVLQTSFDSGVPSCLRNICELLARAATLPFDSLRFLAGCTEPPLRALQNRIVSLSALLGSFVTLLAYLPYTNDDLLQRNFLIWGIACGHLSTSSKAINMCSLFHSTPVCAINHIINSVCIVMRCWITSNCSLTTTQKVSDYVECALHTIRSILNSVHNDGQDMSNYTCFFDLAIAVMRTRGPLLPLVVPETLGLITDLIKFECYSPSDEYDFITILILAVLTCKDVKTLFKFIIQVFDLPSAILSREGDYGLYLIAFAPLFCSAQTSPQDLADICSLADIKSAVVAIQKHFHSTHIKALLENTENFSTQTFAFDLMHTLSSITSDKTLATSAVLLSSMVRLTVGVNSESVFDLGAALLCVRASKEVVDGLVFLTCEATLNQLNGITPSKVRFLQAISNYAHNAGFVYIPTEQGSQYLTLRPEIETEFARIQDQNRANTIYTSEEKVFKVRFDSIETFPPLFPFEEELLKSPLAHVITNFCRRIQVNPQSNWALSLYCASDAAEYNVKVSDEKPKLKLDIPFSQKLTQVLQDVIEEEGISASDGYSPDQVRERQVLLVNESEVYTIGTGENMTHSVDVSSFLPDPVVLEEILGISDSVEY